MCAGWAIAWFFGDWDDMRKNWYDKLGSAMFGIGLGMALASVIIAALKYMP